MGGGGVGEGVISFVILSKIVEMKRLEFQIGGHINITKNY